MASWAPSEGEGSRSRRSDVASSFSQPSPSESAYYACPGPCKRPRWSPTPGYCFNCGQRLVTVQTKERKV